jgi:enterochelin esterase-like enzyme
MGEVGAAHVRERLDASELAADEAQTLADQIRERVGSEALKAGTGQFVDGLDVVWAFEAPTANAQPSVVADLGAEFRLPMRRLGNTPVFVEAAHWANGAAVRWGIELDGDRVGSGQTETYDPHPDLLERPDVPKGKLITPARWHSQVFAGTVRDWAMYLPPRTDGPAALMVFQDGIRQYQHFVPTVFDNLIASGDMPPTVGLFIDPGVFADTTVSNRSFEYDTLSDQYVRFLLDEMLPEVAREQPLRPDPQARAICGISSGGICAFTAAWQQPDQFHKVLSHVGSFTNIASGPTLREGGHNYPFLIRKVPPKPIRVSLQDGEKDLNNASGNWWLANLQMVDALQFAGYDHTFVGGHGFHSLQHGRAIFPDSLRWLWRR